MFIAGASFVWIAFAFWTVFFGATIKERIKALFGAVIGFLAAILMMYITSLFNINIGNISISCLLGVFMVNCLVMYFEKTDKIWLNSISGIFAGIFLTFSGFGIGLNPLNSLSECGTMCLILITYAMLGLLCGFFSMAFIKKFDKKADKIDNLKSE